MTKLIVKSKDNQKSADILIKQRLYSSSVHCSYYSSLQLMFHLMIVDLKIRYEDFEPKAYYESGETSGYHNWLKGIITTELLKRDFMLVRDFNNFFGKLKRQRANADYKNAELKELVAKDCLDLSKQINGILTEKFEI